MSPSPECAVFTSSPSAELHSLHVLIACRSRHRALHSPAPWAIFVRCTSLYFFFSCVLLCEISVLARYSHCSCISILKVYLFNAFTCSCASGCSFLMHLEKPLVLLWKNKLYWYSNGRAGLQMQKQNQAVLLHSESHKSVSDLKLCYNPQYAES